MRAQLAAIAHATEVVALLRPQPDDALGEELGAKPVGLQEGPLGELVTAESLREAEVILDPRAGARLSADCFRFHDQGPQALGCAVHAGRETRRSGADDDDIVELLTGLGAQANPP